MLGTLTIFLAGGFLCQTLGWPSVFYVFGELCFSNPGMWFRDPGHWAQFLGLKSSVAHQILICTDSYVTKVDRVQR